MLEWVIKIKLKINEIKAIIYDTTNDKTNTKH